MAFGNPDQPMSEEIRGKGTTAKDLHRAEGRGPDLGGRGESKEREGRIETLHTQTDLRSGMHA